MTVIHPKKVFLICQKKKSKFLETVPVWCAFLSWCVDVFIFRSIKVWFIYLRDSGQEKKSVNFDIGWNSQVFFLFLLSYIALRVERRGLLWIRSTGLYRYAVFPVLLTVSPGCIISSQKNVEVPKNCGFGSGMKKENEKKRAQRVGTKKNLKYLNISGWAGCVRAVSFFRCAYGNRIFWMLPIRLRKWKFSEDWIVGYTRAKHLQ